MNRGICEICCETFNNSTRKIIKCPIMKCGFESCKSCVKTYLNNSLSELHCMKCKIEWDDEFVIQELNRSYYNKEYKDYRMKLLLEHELSRMKESAGKAEARKNS